jgi:hypothetical protein
MIGIVPCSSQSAAPPPNTNFITRVLTPDSTGFVEKAKSSNDLITRVQKHMREAGIYAGHTIHGTRRGSMQPALQNGMSEEEISRRRPDQEPCHHQTLFGFFCALRLVDV